MQKAAHHARSNKGPSLVQAHVVRLSPHSSWTIQKNTEKQKILSRSQTRPVLRMARFLIEQGS